MVGDIAKTHRRYKHDKREHGYFGCQADTEESTPGEPASQTVYVNLVGTFGDLLMDSPVYSLAPPRPPF